MLLATGVIAAGVAVLMVVVFILVGDAPTPGDFHEHRFAAAAGHAPVEHGGQDEQCYG
jgi:hypothetical protein